MHNASGYNCSNSSVIVELAMGQIPRSIEGASSYNMQNSKSESKHELS